MKKIVLTLSILILAGCLSIETLSEGEEYYRYVGKKVKTNQDYKLYLMDKGQRILKKYKLVKANWDVGPYGEMILTIPQGTYLKLNSIKKVTYWGNARLVAIGEVKIKEKVYHFERRISEKGMLIW